MRDDEFEWDDIKAAANVRKHSLTFWAARKAFDDPNGFDRLDMDEVHEDRWLLTALAGEILVTVCYTERRGRKRIISAWKATQREQEAYNDRSI